MADTPPDDIRITVRGKRAMTRPMLATALGLDPAAAETTIRPALRRAGIAPDGHIDGRTPVYIAAPTLKALKARPGRWPTRSESALSDASDPPSGSS